MPVIDDQEAAQIRENERIAALEAVVALLSEKDLNDQLRRDIASGVVEIESPGEWSSVSSGL